MLPDSELKKGKEVRIIDTGKHAGKVGTISFFEEKHGYKQSYAYVDVTVKFEDKEEGVFKSWNLVSTDYVAEKDEPVIETPAEPEVKKRKTRQAAKRFNLTNTLIEDNILIVQTGLIHNTFEENTMSDTNAAVAVTDTADTTVTATTAVKTPQKRGRKPDPNSKINRAAAFLAALPADQLTKAIAVPLLMKELELTEEVAQVYFYNKRPASARKVRAPKAAKATVHDETTPATDETTVDTTEVTGEDTTSAE
jgi:hypothetical protein